MHLSLDPPFFVIAGRSSGVSGRAGTVRGGAVARCGGSSAERSGRVQAPPPQAERTKPRRGAAWQPGRAATPAKNGGSRLRTRIALLVTLVVAASAALAGTAEHALAGGDRVGAGTKAGRLVAFRSCGDLLVYARSQAIRFVGPYGFGRPASAPGGPRRAGAPTPGVATATGAPPQEGVDYSGTNVQEQGVDEPDIVKTNGTTLYAVSNGMLNAVDVSGPQPRLLATLQLDSGWSHELLLQGRHLLVLSRGGYWAEPLPALPARMFAPVPSQSVLTEVDVANPKALTIVQTLTLDGAYVDARLVGSTVRVVSSSQVPQLLPYVTPTATTAGALAAAGARNRAVVTSSGYKSWLPFYRISRPGQAATTSHALVQCRNVRRPVAFSGLGLLTVLTVDLDKGLTPVDSVAIMTDARTVYASPESLYVATERWVDRPDPATPTEAKSGVTTIIYKFDSSDPARTVYRGSGSVPGYLLSQWSLSEFLGVLRVVSTETPAWWGAGSDSQSYLTTLRASDGALTQVGQIGALGRGDRVYAVRFIGSVGYVVTFRQVDPLYTVDISDPPRPRVLGELTIPGYSAYLHPIGDSLLLGVGQDVDAQGHPLGTQVSLFDVSDLTHPTRLYQATLGPGWSEAEADHHAFLYWPPTGLLVIPFDQRAVGFRVSRASGIAQAGQITHTAGALGGALTIRRSLVVGSTVVTVSDAGVKTSSLSSLADQGWAAFPAPPQPKPVPGGGVTSGGSTTAPPTR